ncbi:MAG: hypothetical protein H6742_02390 [Alphaproteobacteria bacterium]|nr:hypothetical protein [Alphaproteobacteria bacterium]
MSLLLTSLLLLAPGAHAQSEHTQPVTFKPVTELSEDEFRDLEVEGELIGPGGVYDVTAVHKGGFDWIQLRQDFSAEMRRSVDEVR